MLFSGQKLGAHLSSYTYCLFIDFTPTRPSGPSFNCSRRRRWASGLLISSEIDALGGAEAVCSSLRCTSPSLLIGFSAGSCWIKTISELPPLQRRSRAYQSSLELQETILQLTPVLQLIFYSLSLPSIQCLIWSDTGSLRRKRRSQMMEVTDDFESEGSDRQNVPHPKRVAS